MEDKKGNILLLEFFLWIRALIEFVPAVREYSPMLVNVLTVLLVYVNLFALVDGKVVGKALFGFLLIYAIIVVNAICGYISISLFSFLYGVAQWVIWPVSLYYLVDSRKTKSLNRLFYVLTALILFTSITTYYGNLRFPGASRALAAIWSDDTGTAHFYQSLNIGGFDFIYLLVLLIPLWIYAIRANSFKHNLWKIILFALSIVFSFITIITSEYTTALLFSFASLLLFILPRSFSRRKLLLYLVSFFIIIFIGRSVTSHLFTRLADRAESPIVSERLTSLSALLSGETMDGDAGMREELMRKSWDSFLNNPLTGSSQVGGHSFILDAMGHYGVFGLFLVFVVFYGLYRLCVFPHKGTMFYGYCFFVFISQIGLAFVNTHIIYHVFIILIPVISYLFSPKNMNRVL